VIISWSCAVAGSSYFVANGFGCPGVRIDRRGRSSDCGPCDDVALCLFGAVDVGL
jgi:hypothetical protein